MNNYLSLNLVNGRLGRVAGGGRPKFILDEQNEVQLYVLDFPKPSTYPPDSLSDAYAYEIIPRDFSGSSVTLRAGVRGGGAIISTNSFFNLPTNLALNSSGNTEPYALAGGGTAFTFNYFFSTSSIPSSGSIFSFTATVSAIIDGLAYTKTYTGATFSFENRLSEISGVLAQAYSTAFALVQAEPATRIYEISYGELNLYQLSDYSYSFNTQGVISSASTITNLNISVTFNNVSASSTPGKYGYLDFSSPSWDSVIGTKTEAPIWMEAMIGSDTKAQGNAIICRKMT